MIGVIVPAHDEQELIERCLAALQVAAADPRLGGETVCILVVADACADETVVRVARHGVDVVAIDARNVGVARATGANHLIAAGARWLAFTDADSEVAPSWLARQLGLGADAVCGVVAVDDWSELGPQARALYEAHYDDADHHRHVHGANLGVSTDAYLRAGGFEPLRAHEDVALVRSLVATGASIARTNQVRVLTSARRVGRTPEGFAHFLRALTRRAPPLGTAAPNLAPSAP